MPPKNALKTPKVRSPASFNAYRHRVKPQGLHGSAASTWNLADKWEQAILANVKPQIIGTVSLPNKNSHSSPRAGEHAVNYLRRFLNAIHHEPMYGEWRRKFQSKSQQHIVWMQAFVNGDNGQPHVHFVLHFEHEAPSTDLLKGAFDWYQVMKNSKNFKYQFWCDEWDDTQRGYIRYSIACHPNAELEETLCTQRNRCKNATCCQYLKTLQVD